MNVTSLVSNRYAEVENRKRALRQKTADDAYRKNAQYFKPKFNPALEELVDLLTGKKEKDHQPEVQAAIQDLKQQKDLIEQQNSSVNDEIAFTQLANPISLDDKYAQTITTLDDVSDATLAPEKPSQKDLQMASETIQQTQSQSTRETELSNVFQMNDHEKEKSTTISDNAVIAQEKTKQRLFKKAIARYAFHMQMAKQGFHFAEPTIYRAV